MATLYASRFYGLDKWSDALEAACHPTYESTRPLEMAFRTMWLDTQARVHTSLNHATQHKYPYVHTDSLVASGNPKTNFDGTSWSGEISYGGASYGAPNDPVNYAIYEMARGGEHNFFAGLPALEPTLLEAMEQHFAIRARETQRK